MRLLNTIRKNLLVLLRSRLSAFVILFGPLLIILLIGLAFTTPSSYELAVGVTGPSSPLSVRFVENMEQQGFSVEHFDDVELCRRSLQKGVLQTCIEFPEDFEIANDKTNEVVFYVDESRTNFVHQIIESVSSSIGVESAELSQDLTDDILSLLWETEEGVDDLLAQTITTKAESDRAISEAQDASKSAEDIVLEAPEVETGVLVDGFENVIDLLGELRDQADNLIIDGRDVVQSLEGESYAGAADVSGLDTSLDTLSDYLDMNEEETDGYVKGFTDAYQDVLDALDGVEESFSEAREAREGTVESIDGVRNDIASLRSRLESSKADLESLKQGIDDLKVTSSATISRPVVTRIETVTSEGNNLLYVFPYLLVVLLLFIGILLPATLVVMENRSRSTFRIFCTPTRDNVFLFSHFLSAIVIIVLQLVIVLGLSYYFLGSVLLNNFYVTASLVFLSLVLFIFLGMAIGYLFRTQEAVTIVSISFSSVCIFLSNLVLPIETLAPQLTRWSYLNPFVLSSETLRQALLFGASFSDLRSEIITMAASAAIILVVIVIAKDLAKSRFFLQRALTRHFSSPTDAYLRVGDAYIKDIPGLVEWLRGVDDKTYHEQLPWKVLRAWLGKRRSLRVRLAGKPRGAAIKVLESYLAKEKHK